MRDSGILLIWLGLMGAWALLLFGWDKWRAGRCGPRVSEAALFWVCALGGWPGGLLGLVLFRHKTAKASFLLKFAVAGAIWAALLWAAGRSGGLQPMASSSTSNTSVALGGMAPG